MFQLLRFKKVDSLISTMVEFENPTGQLVRHESAHMSFKSACMWVHVHQTNYIRERILKYVTGCHQLAGSDQANEMKICIREAQVIQIYPLENICMAILMMESHLKAILPPETHQQHTLAKQAMRNIIDFAKEVLATKVRTEEEVFNEN